MPTIKQTFAGAGIAALMLATTPFAAFADALEAAPAQGDLQAERVHTVSTMGTPHFAALLNAGTQQSMMELNAFNARMNGIEVAGIQIDPSGAHVQTVSTSGAPMFAAALNAGTSFMVSITSGEVMP
jgi:hypothetical protein